MSYRRGFSAVMAGGGLPASASGSNSPTVISMFGGQPPTVDEHLHQLVIALREVLVVSELTRSDISNLTRSRSPTSHSLEVLVQCA